MDIKLPELSDAFKPLPRLKSLVITELENIGRKNPIDRKVFLYAFVIVFAALVAIALVLPHILKDPVVEHPPQQVSAPPPAPPLTDAQKQAIDVNDNHWHDSLPPVPVKELLDEQTGAPITASDGRTSWNVYARPYDHMDARPRIIIVVTELGKSQQISQSAIADLPGPVTLGFSNLTDAPDAWVERARQAGHEVIMGLPMEPLEYPASDPGPNTILTHHTLDENKALLMKHLAFAKGYVGMGSFSGTRIYGTSEKFRPILKEIKQRGLLWLDSTLPPMAEVRAVADELKLPMMDADFRIDDAMGQRALQQVLAEAEAHAFKSGHSVIVVEPTPLAISTLRNWTSKLPGRNFSLAPLSSLAQ